MLDRVYGPINIPTGCSMTRLSVVGRRRFPFKKDGAVRNFPVVVLALLAVVLGGSEAKAQSLTGRLSILLTEQRPTPAAFVPDPVAAAATRDTVAGLFLVELGSLPAPIGWPWASRFPSPASRSAVSGCAP